MPSVIVWECVPCQGYLGGENWQDGSRPPPCEQCGQPMTEMPPETCPHCGGLL